MPLLNKPLPTATGKDPGLAGSVSNCAGTTKASGIGKASNTVTSSACRVKAKRSLRVPTALARCSSLASNRLRKPNRIRITLPAVTYHQGRAFHEVRTAEYIAVRFSCPRIFARPSAICLPQSRLTGNALGSQSSR